MVEDNSQGLGADSQTQIDKDFMTDGTTTEGVPSMNMNHALPTGFNVRGIM